MEKAALRAEKRNVGEISVEALEMGDAIGGHVDPQTDLLIEWAAPPPGVFPLTSDEAPC